MLGFGKKKNEDKSNASPEDTPGTDNTAVASKKTSKNKKPVKKIIFITLLVLLAVGASSYLVYSMYFNSGDPGTKPPVYKKMELTHVKLPEEMLKFSFDHFPDLYFAMITYNQEMDLIDRTIERIDAVAQKYPDQKQIADKEKKTWIKAQSALQKAFLKIEKPVKEAYVLFQVNKEKGKEKIKEKNAELVEIARTALTTVQELTQIIKDREQVPQGFIKGSIYKLKKKFL